MTYIKNIKSVREFKVDRPSNSGGPRSSEMSQKGSIVVETLLKDTQRHQESIH